MSSSDRLQRPRLMHLGREKPPARQDEFEQRSQFEQLRSVGNAALSTEEIFQNGLVEGEQRGRQAALKELEPVLEEFRAMARALACARKERIEQAQRELTDLGIEIARRILHGELQQPGDVAVRMARVCIEAAQGAEGVLTLHVAPADLELIRTHLPELEVELEDCTLRVVGAGGLPAGHVLLETSQRCYEGRPEQLLEAAATRLRREEDR